MIVSIPDLCTLTYCDIIFLFTGFNLLHFEQSSCHQSWSDIDMYSSTSITEHLELFRFTLSLCKKKKKSLPTYPKFLNWVGRGQTNIFLNAALVFIIFNETSK